MVGVVRMWNLVMAQQNIAFIGIKKCRSESIASFLLIENQDGQLFVFFIGGDYMNYFKVRYDSQLRVA